MPRRQVTDHDLDAYTAAPRAGDVWWCDGGPLRLDDGDKTRPVLVLRVTQAEAEVAPLTTRKPPENAIGVRHKAGLSWLTATRRVVPITALVSTLGPWDRYPEWRKQSARQRP